MFSKKIFFAALMIAMLSLSVSSVLGQDLNTVYVSPSGNDGNTGTSDSPFKTITKAVSVCPEGGTVFLKAGTYSTINDNNILVNKSLTITGEDQATTIIDSAGSNFGALTVPGHPDWRWANTGAVFNIKYNDYNCGKVLIQGLTFKNQNTDVGSTAIAAIAVSFNRNAGINTTDYYQRGIHPNYNTTIKDCTFTNNNIASVDNEEPGTSVVNCSFTNNHRLAIENYHGDITVSDSNFVNNSGGAAGAVDTCGSGGTTLNNCLFSGNTGSTCRDIYSTYSELFVNHCIFDTVPTGSDSTLPSIGHGDGRQNTWIDGVLVDQGVW